MVCQPLRVARAQALAHGVPSPYVALNILRVSVLLDRRTTSPHQMHRHYVMAGLQLCPSRGTCRWTARCFRTSSAESSEACSEAQAGRRGVWRVGCLDPASLWSARSR